MQNSGETPTVLVVEDDYSVSLMLAEVLRIFGYNPVVLATMTEVENYLEKIEGTSLPVAAIVDGNITQDRVVSPEQRDKYRFYDGEKVRDLLLGRNPQILLIGNSSSGPIPGFEHNIEKSPDSLTLIEQILSQYLGKKPEE